ncbi:hypothetical protein UA38_13015 [Photobacterium kishitanii]|uniref:DUF3718 domain-containing protein n=1 Tax=Photobacterium kishitanii TaxID=318456 RepID=A0AAX0YQU3_9GAMM|nr:hypothetical protein [Photobacterium kishitanii]KJG56754.1 hypothetical protein UA38_13015 [Photobacterium kishitanii]KJG60321.1 hypothetical protein UA42_15825 [Photobacterium kishitanii]KJG69189.1 hypothetical protein UA41_12520 [Photobacterium kishitanii]PSX19233.1 hypothetical protein C0W70_12185 [Photobacterium kishitanii]PSX27545.1 hypothetical protein C0W39_22060 [Photobacterium kishitanii]
MNKMMTLFVAFVCLLSPLSASAKQISNKEYCRAIIAAYTETPRNKLTFKGTSHHHYIFKVQKKTYECVYKKNDKYKLKRRNQDHWLKKSFLAYRRHQHIIVFVGNHKHTYKIKRCGNE